MDLLQSGNRLCQNFTAFGFSWSYPLYYCISRCAQRAWFCGAL